MEDTMDPQQTAVADDARRARAGRTASPPQGTLGESPAEPRMVHRVAAGSTNRSIITAVSFVVTIGLAAVAWFFSIKGMSGMDMGVATQLGSFAAFIPLWVLMMGAMMLPGAAPATARYAHASGHLRSIPLFLASYLLTWTLVGVILYAADRPHGTVAAGIVVIAAGLYEFTPLKRHFRSCCRDHLSSGFAFGASCVGCTIGLMLLMVAVSAMSVLWMRLVAIVIVGQKLLPPKRAVDVPVALAIVALGILILVNPSAVPDITPMM